MADGAPFRQEGLHRASARALFRCVRGGMGDTIMIQATTCDRRRWRAIVFQDHSQNRRLIGWYWGTEAWDRTIRLRNEPERAIGTSEERGVEERVNIHQRNSGPADVCNFGGIRVLLVIPKINGDLRGGFSDPASISSVKSTNSLETGAAGGTGRARKSPKSALPGAA